jgi:myosin heavy chain 9/10/11/14
VRPLLAATRSDEELRRKELELAMARERAQRDQQEREALENLKMTLEAEKKKVEDELRSERDVGFEKDSLLERSKKREVELEEEIIALQADLDTLDSQLDRALAIQKESEEKHEALKQAFDHAAEHLVRLESEQQDWMARESELIAQIEATDKDLAELQSQRDEFRALSEDLHNTVSQKEEDLARLRERMELAIGELENKLDTEVTSRYDY